MPAGLPYFAWINASETTFTAGHLRWDESIFSFTLAQEEGDPASLTVVVRKPRNESGDPIGLLGPGRKIWCWFAFDCGPDLIKFRGRLVGIPTSIFEELVTLEFVARPVDVVAQKEALAATLRVLPYYDETLIDEQRRSDPDVVLEGYTKIWAYDRETHIISTSDEIVGEDGTVEFDGVSDNGKIFYDGLGLRLTSGPLSRVDVVAAEFTWTQRARGTVDLTDYLLRNWSSPLYAPALPGTFPSMQASDWPKPGAGLGDGWEVADATAANLYEIKTGPAVTTTWTAISKPWPDGDSTTATFSETNTVVSGGRVLFADLGGTPSTVTHNISSGVDGDGNTYVSGVSYSISINTPVIAIQDIRATLTAGYSAERQFTERVSFTLIADVQPILTDPEDGEALRIDNIRSVNLSETIGAEVPIGDARRRSYIATERGKQSLEHLIALARAHLMKRARVVEITFAPKLARMPEITLRKNVSLIDPRVGVAVGKVIGYSLSLDGSDGRIKYEVRIGCTIGRGGAQVASAGMPTYVTADYTGQDYQQYTARSILFATTDTSVGYEPPSAAPNDDNINFLSGLTADDVIEVPLTVTYGEDEAVLAPITNSGGQGNLNNTQYSALISERDEMLKQKKLAQYKGTAKFKLKSMTRAFTSDYEIQVTDLKIPTGIDLEAV